MQSHNLFKDVKVMNAGAAIAAASNTNDLGVAIDTQGFDGCLFIAPIADSTATGTVGASAEQSDASGGSYAALVGDDATAVSAINDDLNGKCLVVDVFKPRKQFLKLRRVTGVALGAFDRAIAILYNAQSRPTALGDVLARAGVVSPAEG